MATGFVPPLRYVQMGLHMRASLKAGLTGQVGIARKRLLRPKRGWFAGMPDMNMVSTSHVETESHFPNALPFLRIDGLKSRPTRETDHTLRTAAFSEFDGLKTRPT